MKTLHFRVISLAPLLVAARLRGQDPALSGLKVEPTPSSATSLTPTPSPVPAATVLSGGRGELQGAGRGSSLADVVKISKENRKDQKPKKSLGTITNDSLHGGSVAGAKGKGGKVAAKSPTRTPSAGATPAAADVSRDDKGRSEADWRSIMGHQRSLVTDGETRLRDLETRTRQLENDFYAMSDGNRRDAVVKPAWDRAREELTKTRQEVEDARKVLDDLSEDARKSNAPPGWLR